MATGDARGTRYLPALRFDWLTSVFDPVLRVAFRERQMKSHLVAQAAPRPGQVILDIGCGTGTLAILLKRAEPSARIVGLDGDSRVLAIARRKAEAAALDVVWDHGMAYDLPYEDGSFDAVLSSLVLHHLSLEDKRRALREAHRVLRSGGSVHIADFGTPRGGFMRALSKVGALLEETADGIEGRLPSMFQEAGLADVGETAAFDTPLGTVRVWHARRS